jgi:hypothetical protein
LRGAKLADFLPDPGGEEDAVVDAEGDEEDEDVERDRGLDAGVAEYVVPQQVGQPEEPEFGTVILT